MSNRIMFVDDDTDDQELFREALADVDASVIAVTASSTKDALEKLEQGEVLPDMIFLDINMPILTGWDCLAMMRRNEAFRSIPVMMYSTSNHAHDREKAKNMGALGAIAKPADYELLKDNLRRTLAYLRGEPDALI